MKLALIAAVAAALSTAPAVAQTWYDAPPRHEPPRDGGAYPGRDAYRPYGRNQTYGSGARYDFNGQADRPGDYRCDAYWDAARTDCGAAWRDQRPAHTRRLWLQLFQRPRRLSRRLWPAGPGLSRRGLSL